MESFDAAYGGPCGECGGNTTPETAAKLMDAYFASFTKTPVVMMLGTDGCTYGGKVAAAATAGGRLPARPIGWRADCYGDLRCDGQGVVPNHLAWNHMKDQYPREVVANGVAELWRTGPVTFETCWTVGHWYQKGWDLDWILDQGLKYHPSVFMPKSSYIPDAWRDQVEAFCRRLGYRFVLRQLTLPLEAKAGAPITALVWVDNVGVAPLYHPYRLALRFRQGATAAVVLFANDPRRWLPEYTWFREDVVVPPALQRGEVKLDLGLVDATTLAPRVHFANEPVAADGWLPLTSLDVR